jgi:hypothetical protein
MKNPTNWKTTAIGIVGLIYLLSGLFLVIYKLVTIAEFAASLAFVSVFLTSLIGIFAKDADKPNTDANP